MTSGRGHGADPDPAVLREQRARARAAVSQDRDRRGRNRWWRRGLRIVRRAIGGATTWLLLPATLRVLGATWRVERSGFEHFTSAFEGDGFLIAIWHGDMLAPLPVHARMGIRVLVSPSGDGALVKMVLERFGYGVIRGSSNRGSARALREMRSHLRQHGAVVITPDGPRGPRHSMNLGLAWLARETGCPIVTIRIACDRAWHLRSWDRFAVPKPRARVALHYSAPLQVPPDADDARLEAVTEQVRRNLMGE